MFDDSEWIKENVEDVQVSSDVRDTHRANSQSDVTMFGIAQKYGIGSAGKCDANDFSTP